MESEWKFRCDADLRARFERVATLRRRRSSDLSRMVFEDFVASEERALGLVLPNQPASQREPPTPYGSRTPAETQTPEEIARMRAHLKEFDKQQAKLHKSKSHK